MTLGILTATLFIHESNSLKAKRMVLHSVKARLRNSFNVAVTEIDAQDKWQKSVLAIAGVTREKRDMDALLCRVINFLKKEPHISLLNHEMELI